MKINLKKLLILIALVSFSLPNTASAQVSNNPWKIISNVLQPVVSSWVVSSQYSSSTAYASFNTASSTSLIVGTLRIPALADGCLNITSGTVGSAGVACGSGSGSAFPFTVNTGYNSTSTTLAFLNGFFSTASSTIVGNATTTGIGTFGTLKVGNSYIGTTTAVVCKTAGQCDYTTIGAAITAGYRDIFVKDGTYAEQITMANTKTKLRAQSLLTIIQCNGATQSPCITPTDESVVDGFTINETNAALVGVAFDASNHSLTKFVNNRVNNFSTSTKFSDTGNLTFYNTVQGNTFFNVRSCFEFSGTLANANWLYNNRCRPALGSGGFGLYVENARGVTMIGGDIEGPAGEATSGTSTGIYFDATSRDNYISGVWEEALGTGLMIVSGSNNNTIIGTTITSNGTNQDIIDNGTNTRLLGINRTGTKLFNVGNATSTNFGVTSLTAANCDVKAASDGSLYCGTDSTGTGSAFPFTVNTGYNSTTTVIGFNGLFSTASSTFSGDFFLPALTQGFAYVGSAGKVNTIASSSINVSWFNNDAGYKTFAWPFTPISAGVVATTSQINMAGFLSTASSTIVGNATTTGSMGAGAIYVNGDYITDFTGTNLSVTNGVLNAAGGAGNSFAWPFDAQASGVSTSTTLILNNGLNATASSTFSATTTFTGSGGLYRAGVIPTGDVGASSAPVRNGAFIIDNTLNTATPGLYVSSDQAGVPSNPLVIFRSSSASYNQGLLWLLESSTNSGGAAYGLKITGGNPDAEFDESDQTSPAGDYEIDVNNDLLRFNGRNAANSSFDTIAWFSRFDKGQTGGGGRFCLGCGFTDLETSMFNLVGTTTQSLPYFSISTASTSAATGDILLVNSSGNVGIGTTSPGLKLEVDGQVLIQGTPGATNSAFGVRSGDYTGYWDILAQGTNGWFTIYDHKNNKNPFYIAPSSLTNSFYMNTNGAIGLGTSSGQGHLHIWNPFSTTLYDPISIGLANSEAYDLVLQNSTSVNASSTGIGFTVTNTLDNIGGSIVFQRTGGNSMGELIFYTKQSTTANAAPTEVLRLHDNGTLATAGLTAIGTSTALYTLNSYSSTASQLALSAGAGINQWAFRNAGGNLYLSTTTVAGNATTSISALEISGSGFGTTTLRGLNISGQATTTSNVGINLSGGCFAVNNVCISGGGGSGTVTQINTTWPIVGGPITTTGTLTFDGISTSTTPTIGNLSYWTGVNKLGTVATSSASCSGGASCSAFTVVGSVAPNISVFNWPWTVNTGYNSTTTVMGFLGGLFSTASSTFSGTLTTNDLFTIASTSNIYYHYVKPIIWSVGSSNQTATANTWYCERFELPVQKTVTGVVYTAGSGQLGTNGSASIWQTNNNSFTGATLKVGMASAALTATSSTNFTVTIAITPTVLSAGDYFACVQYDTSVASFIRQSNGAVNGLQSVPLNEDFAGTYATGTFATYFSTAPALSARTINGLPSMMIQFSQ